MYERVKERYMKYYVTDVQLARYVSLGVVTEEQAEEIKATRAEEEKRIADQIATERAEIEAAEKESAEAARARAQDRAHEPTEEPQEDRVVSEGTEEIESEAVDDE